MEWENKKFHGLLTSHLMSWLGFWNQSPKILRAGVQSAEGLWTTGFCLGKWEHFSWVSLQTGTFEYSFIKTIQLLVDKV